MTVRYEGTAARFDGVPGSPNIVYEITFFNPALTGGVPVAEIRVGAQARGTSGPAVSGLYSATGKLPGGDLGPSNTGVAADQSYVMVGNSTGTSWTVYTGSSVAALAPALVTGTATVNLPTTTLGRFSNTTASPTGLPSNSVSGVSVSGGTIYAATGSYLGVSTDGGTTFTQKSAGLGSNLVYGVYTSGSNVYAATYGGLSISTKGGTTFTNHTTANGLGNNTVYGVYASGSNVYAATNGGFSISTDGGTTFTNHTTANGLGNNTVNGVYANGDTI